MTNLRDTVIVGMEPNARLAAQQTIPLTQGMTAERLARWAGLSGPADLPRYFWLANLYDTPVAGGWAQRGAAERAEVVAHQINEHEGIRLVVLLGSPVRRAFGLGSQLAPYEFMDAPDWLHLDGKQVAWTPHPSGLNRQWNDPDNIARATKFFTGLRMAYDRRVHAHPPTKELP